METKQLVKAIIAVMSEVEGIEKSQTVGTGSSSYQGVADQQVKKIIGESMAKHGLSIIPIAIEPTVEVHRWEVKEYPYQKQSVFTQVRTKYLLMHISGESMEIAGYGHGVDSQDKSAGKATTYALKYALLYTFMVPTGKIDDSDNTHSNDIVPPKIEVKAEAIVWLTDEKYQLALKSDKKGIIATLQVYNGQQGKSMTPAQNKGLTEALAALNTPATPSTEEPINTRTVVLDEAQGNGKSKVKRNF